MATTETCHRCVYAHFDLNLWARTLWSGFPARPMCANRPGALGVMREISGGVCPNYREKPPDPDAQAKRIILTNGMIAYVDAADYEELSRYTWHYASGGYAARYENRTLILMHRQIMKPPKGMQVDHIRHNRLDNTRARLRICRPSENARNRRKRGSASSRYFGVTYNKRRKKWVASLKVEGRVREVGFSYDEKEAARAHDYAAVLYLDDFARLNFPEEWPPERKAQVRAQRDTTTKEGEKAVSTTPRATRAERRATKKSKSRRTDGRGRKARRTTAPKRPQRKTHNAKRTTKSKRATGHRSRATTPKGRKTKKA